MSLVHKPMVWGYIIGVTVLGCIAGCSLKHEPGPLPPASPAHKKAAPAGKSTTTQVGMASWYGPGFHGQETASGETFDQHALTAANRSR